MAQTGNGRPVEGRGEVWACYRPVQRKTRQGPSLPERREPFLVLLRSRRLIESCNGEWSNNEGRMGRKERRQRSQMHSFPLVKVKCH